MHRFIKLLCNRSSITFEFILFLLSVSYLIFIIFKRFFILLVIERLKIRQFNVSYSFEKVKGLKRNQCRQILVMIWSVSQNWEWRNVERLISQDFKISHIKITKVDLMDFSFFSNFLICLHFSNTRNI